MDRAESELAEDLGWDILSGFLLRLRNIYWSYTKTRRGSSFFYRAFVRST